MLFLIISLSFVTFLLVIWYLVTPKKYDIKNSHVLITGGSSGIGKSLAIESVKRGSNVTLLARNKKKLQEAVDEIKSFISSASSQKVQGISCDVSGDFQKVTKAVAEAEANLGPIGVLINCAGISAAGAFQDVPIEDYQKVMNVNYMGSVNVTRAVIGSMKKQNSGRIVFVSSQAGQLGIFGYCPYSPSKFALRGLAEALQMEVTPYNIRVTVSFPPDTETPGFREEMESGLKPEETILISDTSGIFKSEEVAKGMIEDMLAGKFLSNIGLDGWMLSTITAGGCPITSLREFLEQVFLSGLLRMITLFYLLSFDGIVRKCKAKRDKIKHDQEQKKDH